MPWYNSIKTASPAGYDSRHIPVTTTVPQKRADRFFQFLKKLGITHRFFHGTSSAIVGKTLDDNRILAQKALTNRVTKWAEPRKFGTDQVFYSASKTYAMGYSKRQGKLTKSSSVILELEIPLYAITEIRHSIYNPYDTGDKYSPASHVSPQGVYNESGYHNSVTDIIQPRLKEIKSRKDEQKVFNEIVSALKTFLNKKTSAGNSDEWTTWYALDTRHIKQTHFYDLNSKDIGPSVGASTATELEKKLKDGTAEEKTALKALIRKQITRYPADLALLSPMHRNSPTLLKAAGKAWAKQLKGKAPAYGEDTISGINQIQFMPEIFLTNEFYKKGPKGKITDEAEPVKEIVLGTLCPHCKGKGLEPVSADIMTGDRKCTVCKGAKRTGGYVNVVAAKINNAYSLSSITTLLKEIPSQLMNDSRILPAMKNKIEQQGTKEPLAALRLMEKLPHIISADVDLINRITASIITASIGDMPAAEVVKEWSEMPQQIKNMPGIIEKYLNNAPPLYIQYQDFPEETIAKFADSIAERFSKTINNQDFGDSMYYFDKLPQAVRDKESIVTALTAKAIKYTETNGAQYLFSHWHKLPQAVKDNTDLRAKLVKSLETYEVTSYGIWDRVPEEFSQYPQIGKKLNQYHIYAGNLNKINYDLLPDDLKGTYKEKLAISLKGKPSWYDTAPPELKNDPEILSQAAKGWEYQILQGYASAVSDEIWANPNFEQYKASIIDAQFKTNSFSGIKYDELSPDLQQKYIQSAANVLSMGKPTLFNELNPTVKNNPAILKALSQGYVKTIQKGYGASVPDEIMELPGFQPYKIDIAKAKLKSTYFYLTNYETLPDELKPTYMEAALETISKDPAQWEKLPDQLKHGEKVYDAVAKGYIYRLNYDGYIYMNEELKALPAFKGHLKQIHQAQMKTHDIWKLPYEELEPELQAEWMASAQEKLKESPSYHEYVPENLQSNPALMKATIEGIKKNVANGNGLDIPYTLKKAPNYKDFSADISVLEKQYWIGRIKSSSSYDPYYKQFYYIGSPELINDKDIIDEMETQLKKGFSLSATSMKSAKASVSQYISPASITPENKARLDAALEIGLKEWLKNRLIYNPGYFGELPEDERSLPYVSDIFAEALNAKIDSGKLDLYYLGSYYQYTKYLNPDKAKGVQDKIADLFYNKISKSDDQYAKDDWCSLAASMMDNHPKLKDACKPTVDIWINKIDNTYNLQSQANFYNQGIQQFPDDAKLLAKKDDIVQSFVQKLTNAGDSGKEEWYNVAKTYGFGEQPEILAIMKPNIDNLIEKINNAIPIWKKSSLYDQARNAFPNDPKLEPIRKQMSELYATEIKNATGENGSKEKEEWYKEGINLGLDKSILGEAYSYEPTVDSYIAQIAIATKKTQFELFEKAQKSFPNDPKLQPIKKELVDFVVQKINDATSQEHKQMLYNNAMEYPSFKNVPEIEEALHPKPKIPVPVAPAPVAQPAAMPTDAVTQAKINKIMAMPELYDKANACTMALKSQPTDAGLLALKEQLVDQFVAKINSSFTATAKSTVCHYAKVYLGAHAKIDQVCAVKK